MVDPMKLYKCPVCKNGVTAVSCFTLHVVCDVRTEAIEGQEVCDKFEHNGKAQWIQYADCPECEAGGMPYQDKFGATCGITGCTFNQEYEK